MMKKYSFSSSISSTSLLLLMVMVTMVWMPSSTFATASEQSSSAITTSDASQAVCTIKGRVFTQRKWYGYLFQKSFHQNFAKIVYQITYPVKECCSNLLIYYDDQIKQLKPTMSCEERTSVLPPNNNQIIPLIASNDSNGCTFWNETGESFYVCRGERIFRSSMRRTWFFALSHCGQEGPLNLNYVFNITGYHGECEEDPLASTSMWTSYVKLMYSDKQSNSSKEVYTYLSISLGILAGIGLILAAVFFALWFLGLRKAAKGKGSSVTSSQATMTQDDIFYVNPSLSDREQAEYSQSGSENYYEVIPERRSYESINTGGIPNGAAAHIRQLRAFHGALGHPLAGPAHAHGHPHAAHAHAHGHPHASHPHPMGHHLTPHHPGHQGHPGHPHMQTKEAGGMRGVTYTFEDYPPPPYQPPRSLGMSKHNGMPHGGHAHSLSVPAGAGQHRPRPQLVHHAYHSSVVPTSAALGIDSPHTGNINNSTSNNSMASSSGVGGPISTSGGMMTHPNSMAMSINGNAPSGAMSLNLMNPLSPSSNSSGGPSSSSFLGNATTSGNSGMSGTSQGTSSTSGGGQNLGTFGQPHISSANNNAGGINMSGMGMMPVSSGSGLGGPGGTPSLATALSSTSGSHMPPSSMGQSETIA